MRSDFLMTHDFCAAHVFLDLISQTELHYIQFAHYVLFILRLVTTDYAANELGICHASRVKETHTDRILWQQCEGKRPSGRHRRR